MTGEYPANDPARNFFSHFGNIAKFKFPNFVVHGNKKTAL